MDERVGGGGSAHVVVMQQNCGACEPPHNLQTEFLFFWGCRPACIFVPTLFLKTFFFLFPPPAFHFLRSIFVDLPH